MDYLRRPGPLVAPERLLPEFFAAARWARPLKDWLLPLRSACDWIRLAADFVIPFVPLDIFYSLIEISFFAVLDSQVSNASGLEARDQGR